MAEISARRSLGSDVNAAPKLLSITGSLYVVVVLLYSVRIYTRFRCRRVGWDDYLITLALVSPSPPLSFVTTSDLDQQIFALAEYALLIVAVHYGMGHHNHSVPNQNLIPAEHFLFASSLPWAASIMFIKVSIACMLLRIKHTPPWRICLWAMIMVQILSCLASLFFQLMQCVPLSYMWDPARHPDGECARPEAAFVSLYVNSGIGISTDLLLAGVPIVFICKMNVPLREKIVLSCLMGLGVFATAASIIKTTFVRNYGRTGDTLWDAVPLTLWSILEEQTGIIAACVPCLKTPFERTLRRAGVLSTQKTETGYIYASNHHRTRIDSHQLPPLRLGLTRGFFGHGSAPGHDIDTNLSSSLGAKSSIGRSTTIQSEETIWPRGPADEAHEESFRQMMAEGGILLTTEFQIKSEVMSRAGSVDEGQGVVERELEREREIEEWRVERPSCEGRGGAKGWDVV